MSKKKVALCAIVKDEQRYIREWAEWHLGLGIEKIFVYEDFGSGSHADALSGIEGVEIRPLGDVVDEGSAKSHDFSWRQKTLYDRFLSGTGQDYDWVLLTDVDEFLAFEEGYDLDWLTGEFSEVSGVALNWKMFGASGHVLRPDGGVVENYTETEDVSKGEVKWCFKSLVNVGYLRDHAADSAGHWLATLHEVAGAVNVLGSDEIYTPVYEKAWINHYFTKSLEDWVDRLFVRGDLIPGFRNVDDFFAYNPSMAEIGDDVLRELEEMTGFGGAFLSRKNGVVPGGNIRKLDRLNHELSKEAQEQAAASFAASRDAEWQVTMPVGDGERGVLTSKCGCTTLAWCCAEYMGAPHSGATHADAEPYKTRGVVEPCGEAQGTVVEPCGEAQGTVAEPGAELRGTEPETGTEETFAVWRDPVERFGSFYADCVAGYNSACYWVLKENLLRVGVGEIVERVAEELEKAPHDIDQHIRRQMDTYPMEHVDVIVRLEDLDAFLDSRGIAHPKKRLNASNGHPFIGPLAAARIRRMYAADYEMLERYAEKVWVNPEPVESLSPSGQAPSTSPLGENLRHPSQPLSGSAISPL